MCIDPGNGYGSFKLNPQPRPLINKPPPQNRDYNRVPNIKALRSRESINHGSTLGYSFEGIR